MKHALLFIAILLLGPFPALAQQTNRVSVSSAGAQGDSSEYHFPVLSEDGRYAAFASASTTLVPGDTNGTFDVFLHDRQTATTTRVSVSSGGAEGNGGSGAFYVGCCIVGLAGVAISDDGTTVAYASAASTLVPGDANFARDIFVYDRPTGVTSRVSVDSLGLEADDHSWRPSLSRDGRYVAFQSFATNLVPGDTNGVPDVFVHDRTTGTTTRVSVSSMGVEGNGDSYSPSISDGGRYVAFPSDAANLVAGDANGTSDVFLHDLQTGSTERISIGAGGAEGDSDSFDASISGDGSRVAFVSAASNLVAMDTNGLFDIFVRDRTGGTTTRANVSSAGAEADGFTESATLSGDGLRVAFNSYASNLVAGDTNLTGDVFVHDLSTGSTERVSLGAGGVESPLGGFTGSIAPDGCDVVFTSGSSNLVAGDTNGFTDVFVRDRGPLVTLVYCSGKTTSQGCVPFVSTAGAGKPSVSDTNPFVVRGNDHVPGQAGLLIYGTKKANLNFHGGKLCVKAPIRAAGKAAKTKASTACAGATSTGRLSFDFNGRIQSGLDPMLTVGQNVFAQWQQRDPANTFGGFGDNASNGIRFTIVP